jgi:hypothetical protein
MARLSSLAFRTPIVLGALVLTSSCSTGAKSTSGTGTAHTTGVGATTTGAGGAGGNFGINGGTLDALNFAIVGDTRPTNENDTASYPTAVITKIWQEVEATSPHPAFALGTGDYQFASTTGANSGLQVGLYMTARATFTGPFFPTMGNHECTGATASNCVAGADGTNTTNLAAFLTKMLAPIQQTKPYYEIDIASTTAGAWTAKFVFVAANAWDATQSAWLDAALAKTTTYTFVLRHERSDVTTTPGVSPSAAIIVKHPFTALIVGHTHTYYHDPSTREIVVGNGGAPLGGNVNYGYVVANQRASDGAIEFQSIDYSTGKSIDSFGLKPDGTPAP